MPRSGNTLFTSLMNQNPDLVVTPNSITLAIMGQIYLVKGEFVFQPIAVWGIAVSSLDLVLPVIQTEGLMSLTLALLGLGGMRTAEKWKGVQRNNMKR